MSTPTPVNAAKSHHSFASSLKKSRKSIIRPKGLTKQPSPQPTVTPTPSIPPPPPPSSSSSSISVIPPPPAPGSQSPVITDIPPPPTPSPLLSSSSSSQPITPSASLNDIQPPPHPLTSSTSSTSIVMIPPPPTPSPSPLIPPPPPPAAAPSQSATANEIPPPSTPRPETESGNEIPPPPMPSQSSGSRSASFSSTASGADIPPPPSPLSPRGIQSPPQHPQKEEQEDEEHKHKHKHKHRPQKSMGGATITSPSTDSASCSSSSAIPPPPPSPLALNVMPPPPPPPTSPLSTSTGGGANDEIPPPPPSSSPGPMPVPLSSPRAKTPRSQDVFIPPPPLPADLKASIVRNRRPSTGVADIPPPLQEGTGKMRKLSAGCSGDDIPPPLREGTGKTRKLSAGCSGDDIPPPLQEGTGKTRKLSAGCSGDDIPPPLPADLKASIVRNRRPSTGVADIPPPLQEGTGKTRKLSAGCSGDDIPPPLQEGTGKTRKLSAGCSGDDIPPPLREGTGKTRKLSAGCSGDDIPPPQAISTHKGDTAKAHRLSVGLSVIPPPPPPSDAPKSDASDIPPPAPPADTHKAGKSSLSLSSSSDKKHGNDIPAPLPADLKASIINRHKDKGSKKHGNDAPAPMPADLKASIINRHKDKGSKKHGNDIPAPLPADLKASIVNNPKTSGKRGIRRFLPADLKASIVSNRKSTIVKRDVQLQLAEEIKGSSSSSGITRNPKFNTITHFDIPPPLPPPSKPDAYEDVVAEVRGKYKFPGFSEGTKADSASQRALEHAFELEVSYITAVNVLSRCYHRGLRAALGRLAERDLAEVFAGVEEMVASAGEVARKIAAVASSGERFFLLSVYMSSTAYMRAYTMFLEMHGTSLFQLNTLQLTSEGFRRALAACTPPHGPELLDLFWLVAARFKHICKIAQTQYVYCKSYDGLMGSIKASVQFDADRMNCCCCCPNGLPGGAPPEDAEGNTNSSRVEEDLKKIHETQPLVNQLAGIHESLGFVRRIHCRDGLLASSLKRKVLDTATVTLQHKREFGLSFAEPAFLHFFNDGVALCTAYRRTGPEDASKYLYELKDWYPAKELCAMKLTPQNFTTIGFKVARRVPCAAAAATAPKEHSSGHSALHILSQSQEGNNDGGGDDGDDGSSGSGNGGGDNGDLGQWAFEDMRTVLVDNSGAYETCTRLFREVSGREVAGEVRPCAFPMIGVPLGALVAGERGLYGNRSHIPVLARFLLDYITARGIEEKGVFRVTAEKNQVDMLAQRVNTVELSRVGWDAECTRVVSSLFKLFLRDMPAPLIPEEAHDEFVRCVAAEPHSARIAAYAQCIAGLRPRAHRATLARLVRFLSVVARNSHYNSMNSKNLAIVTAPSILWKSGSTEDIVAVSSSNNAIEFLIDYYDEIFFYLDSIIDADATARTCPGLCTEIAHYYDDDEKEDGAWVALRCKLLGHNAPIAAAIRTPDGAHILSVDEAGGAMLWDATAATFEREVPLGLTAGAPVALASSAGTAGGRIWVVTPERVRVLDGQTLEDVGAVPIACSSAAAVADGAEMWCGCAGGVSIVSTETLEVVENVLIGGENGSSSSASVIITHIAADDARGRVWAAGWDAGQRQQHVYVWERAGRRLLAEIPAHTGRINSLRVWLGAVYTCSDDLTVGVWDAETMAAVRAFAGHKGPILDTCLVRGGEGEGEGKERRPSLWTCSADRSILVWDPVTHKKIGSIGSYHGKEVTSMVVIERKEYTEVWTASADNTFCVWYSSQICVDLK